MSQELFKEKKVFERKFLIDCIPELIELCSSMEITDLYLTRNSKAEIRYRKLNDTYMVKTKIYDGDNCYKTETYLEHGKTVFDSLLNKEPIVKKRYIIIVDNRLVQIDKYINPSNLNIAKVEFNNSLDADEFIKPSWFNEEITNEESYKGVNLFEEINNGKIYRRKNYVTEFKRSKSED